MGKIGEDGCLGIWRVDKSDCTSDTYYYDRKFDSTMMNANLLLGFGKYFYNKNRAKTGFLMEFGFGYLKYRHDDRISYIGLNLDDRVSISREFNIHTFSASIKLIDRTRYSIE